MLMKDGLIVPGARHYSPEMRTVLRRIYGPDYKFQVREQGFIDAKGNFLSRVDAWRIADHYGQILEYDPQTQEKTLRPPRQGDSQELFSEQLY
jgi:hypothetical protein